MLSRELAQSVTCVACATFSLFSPGPFFFSFSFSFFPSRPSPATKLPLAGAHGAKSLSDKTFQSVNYILADLDMASPCEFLTARKRLVGRIPVFFRLARSRYTRQTSCAVFPRILILRILDHECGILMR